MAFGSTHLPNNILSKESAAGLAILPILATVTFYVLPVTWQAQRFWQFFPQILAYAGFGLWALQNTDVQARLGLEFTKIKPGVWTGLRVGLFLGSLNTALILYGAPVLGIEIEFLRETPHALVPLPLMVPWFILLIAFGVEINFRGFILGRMLALFGIETSSSTRVSYLAQIFALGISALLFACDPFMVTTFQSLHWIAVWDGLIWGWIWLRTRNLYVPIAAHAIEVLIELLTIRSVLA